MDDQERKILENTIKNLRKELKKSEEETLSATIIKREIFNIADIIPNPPKWVLEPKKKSGSGPGVPTLLLSDWHWSETVEASQIGGTNQFNLPIARKRAKTLLDHTLDLLHNHVVNPAYPGIVVALGGDLVSGDIHEELTETNEQPIMPTIIDIFGVFISLLSKLADHFHNIFIPAVIGNHGRTTQKWRYKNTPYSNYDWLIYQLLAKHFENDKRFTFLIADGPDIYYRVFNHRFLLTHGNQFRGGDGLIGPLGAITRGDHKKRSRNMEIAWPYDTIVMGHFHSLMMLRRIIVNSSLKGYDELAWSNNYPYEPPQQAMWLNHPRWGITFSFPVLVEEQQKIPIANWVSIGEYENTGRNFKIAI